jgi:hypothetical protein
MYITRLHVKNLKRMRDLALDFTHEGKPRMWTVFVAENGACKTTLLQAIGLVASGSDRANQLADVPSLPDLRRPTEASVRLLADFEFGTRLEKWRLFPAGPKITFGDQNAFGLRSSLGRWLACRRSSPTRASTWGCRRYRGTCRDPHRARPRARFPSAGANHKLGRADLLTHYDAHVHDHVRPRTDAVHEAIAREDEDSLRASWRRVRGLLSPRMPFVALSFDVIEHFVPADVRGRWGLALPRPPVRGP